jgi:hypothetical protein
LKSRAWSIAFSGVYSYWTFDAQAVARGKQRQATTTTRPQHTGTIRPNATRAVQHVRWEPASGHVDHFFDDEPVPGTQGVSHTLLRQVEPFATAELVPYDTAFLSGFIVEHYQVVLVEAAQASQDAMTEKLRQMCASEIPGDTYRNLVIHPTFSAQTFKHILVPVWLLSYLYGTRMFQVVVNGYSGQMAGQYPKSPWKIAFLVLLAIIASFIFVMLSQNN